MEDDGVGYDRGSQALILPQRRNVDAEHAKKAFRIDCLKILVPNLLFN